MVSDDDLGFAPLPFNPDAALQALQRALRDLKLTVRGSGFELRGRRVLELSVDGAAVLARIARKPALTPDWDKLTIASAADQRKLLDDVKKRLARWQNDE